MDAVRRPSQVVELHSFGKLSRFHAECGMDSACVTCSTPARFKLCGSPPALHIAPEQSGAGFGEHHFAVRQCNPLLHCHNGPGTQTPARFSFPDVE